MSTTNTWYSKTTNTGSPHEQGLVIDEATGKNIAVTYDAKHAPLVASAPELLVALELVAQCPYGCAVSFRMIQDAARAAIAKATT